MEHPQKTKAIYYGENVKRKMRMVRNEAGKENRSSLMKDLKELGL